MAIERPDRTDPRPFAPRVTSVDFDDREHALAEALRAHILLRDACLAPSALMADKLDATECPPSLPVTGHAPEMLPLGGRLGAVARMSTIRGSIRDVGALLGTERRRLVLLDILAGLPDASGPGWSRDPVTLLGEAAAGIGFRPAEVRRLARQLDVARRALPPVEVVPTATRAVADSLRAVCGGTPAAATARSVLMLTDTTPPAWSPPPCGAVLLEEHPAAGRMLGTMVAQYDLAAFTADLATLRVASGVADSIHARAAALLPALARDLRCTAAEDDRSPLTAAASLVDRTHALLGRGFHRFDRTGRSRWVVLDT